MTTWIVNGGNCTLLVPPHSISPSTATKCVVRVPRFLQETNYSFRNSDKWTGTLRRSTTPKITLSCYDKNMIKWLMKKALTSRGTSSPWHVFFARQQLPRLCQLLHIEVNNLLTVANTNLTTQVNVQVRALQRQDTPEIYLTGNISASFTF